MGPAVNSLEKILQLIQAGMNVARLNFSHGTHEAHAHFISLLKEARKQAGVPLAIMLDTKGPEIRLGKVTNGEFPVAPGQQLLLVKEQVEGNSQRVTINPGFVLEKLPVGAQILFDDGYILSKIIKNSADGVLIEIENAGMMRSGKGVCIPDVSLNLPAITEKDIADIRFGCEQDIDIIAASFVRSAEDVLEIKKLLAEEKKSETLVVAKIENREGIQNFDSIVQVADGIMIARGDLGVQVPLSQVPKFQKMMIRKSYLVGKPSVTATQMLESMIQNPRPTRAEASDVANAIYDSTSAVMLSGETAVGKYAIDVVNVMKSIVQEAEMDFHYQEFFAQHGPLVYHDVPSAVTLATVKTAYSSHARAIFAFTVTGSTARLLSRLRPSMPIVALTPNEKSYHQMAFFWGVIPFLNNDVSSLQDGFHKISQFALEKEIVSYGDLVVVTAGSPFGISGTTNMMMVESIGEVLVRGHIGHGHRVHGNITHVVSPDSRKPYSVRGQLLVLTMCDKSYQPLIQESAGVILQNHMDDIDSEVSVLDITKKLNKPVLVRADEAFRILKEGQLVTLDPEKALVYKGVVLSAG